MKKIFIWIGVTVVLALFVYAALEVQESRYFNARTIHQLLYRLGPFAALGYVVMMIIAVVTPVPDAMVSIAGGYLFGPFVGSILSLLGLSIGTSFNFLIARRLGRNYVKKKYPKSIHIIDSYATKFGWQTTVIMRMLPSVTFDLLGYAAGISSMPYTVYIASTLLGAIPMVLFTVLLGNSLWVGSVRYVAGVLLIGVLGLVVGTIYVNKKKSS